MAAILCQGCTEICHGGCEVCGAVCRAPCTLCSTVCKGCGGCCEDFCGQVAKAMGSPFALYVGVTVLLNVPPLIIGLTEAGELVDMGDVCQGSMWLGVNSMACAIHIIAAIYMAQRVMNSSGSTILGDVENPGPTSTSGRISHLLCYDPWMAVYILIIIGYFIWLSTGGMWTLSGNVETGCQVNVTSKVVTALGFGWAFLSCGIGALFCSVGCAMLCGIKDTTFPTTTTTTTTTAPTTHYVNASAIPNGKPSVYDNVKSAVSSSIKNKISGATTNRPPAQSSTIATDNLPVAHAVPF